MVTSSISRPRGFLKKPYEKPCTMNYQPLGKKHLARSIFNILPKCEKQTFSRTLLKESRDFISVVASQEMIPAFLETVLTKMKTPSQRFILDSKKPKRQSTIFYQNAQNSSPTCIQTSKDTKKKHSNLSISLQTLLTKPETQFNVIGYINAIIKHPTQ